MTKSNTSLHRARTAKDDEFYTQYDDVAREMHHYKEQFRGKVVFCNCDDPETSNFWKFFVNAFKEYGLKELVATHYNPNGGAYALRVDEAGEQSKYELAGNGDFRSAESLALLNYADIIVTNPPFSLFREYIAQLITNNKQFLVIGNYNAVTYKEIFPLIKGNKMWLGVSPGRMEFRRPDGRMQRLNNVAWYTNMPNIKRKTEQRLFRRHEPALYPKYDNYDAIEVSKVINIPSDYAGCMGVPITFLEKFNPDQFEIVDANEVRSNAGVPLKSHGLIKDKDGTINGVATYVRIVIRNKMLNVP